MIGDSVKTLKVDDICHKTIKKEAAKRETKIETLTKEILQKGMEILNIKISK